MFITSLCSSFEENVLSTFEWAAICFPCYSHIWSTIVLHDTNGEKFLCIIYTNVKREMQTITSRGVVISLQIWKPFAFNIQVPKVSYPVKYMCSQIPFLLSGGKIKNVRYDFF